MSDYRDMVVTLTDYIRAGVPLVVVRTIERHRVEQALRQIAIDLGITAFCYTDSRQVETLGAQSGPAKDVDSDPLTFVKDRFRGSRHVSFLLADTRRLSDDSLYTRELLSLTYLARDTGNTLIVVASENLWNRLSRFGLFIDLDLPTFEERYALIEQFAAQHSDRVAFSDTGKTQLSTLLRGLSEIQIVNLLRSSAVRNLHLQDADVSEIAQHKDRLFTPVSNIAAVDYPDDLQVAGLERLKAWLDRKHDVFFAPREVLGKYCLQAPKGLLLMGVPGCGKSFSAKMIASRWRLPLFRFDLGSVYNKYVGETERRMQEALDYIDNVAPCVLWIDEIEKALSAQSGESDVGNRVLGQFLFWLQESKAKVFLVATANNVEALPPELFRKGRFSESFFIDLPNARERAAVIDLYSRLSLHRQFSCDELDALADRCEGFSYSDIEQAVKEVAESAIFGGLTTIDAAVLGECFEHVIPISQERLKRIRQWGAANAQNASAQNASAQNAQDGKILSQGAEHGE